MSGKMSFNFLSRLLQAMYGKIQEFVANLLFEDAWNKG
jgi:hypothetical protein